MQLVTGDYPDLQMLHQRALHQQLDFTHPLRLAALRLDGLSRLFRRVPARTGRSLAAAGPPQRASAAAAAASTSRATLPAAGAQQHVPFSCCRMRRGKAFSRKMATAVAAGAGGRRGEFVAALRPLRAGQAAAGLSRGRCRRRARRWICAIPCGRPSASATISSWGFIKLLSAVSDPALLNDFMHDTLGCLIEPGRKAPWLLLETLETLLQENGNVVRAADRLGLHRNTLHQRIQRIEKLTGYPVSHPQFHLNASGRAGDLAFIAKTIYRTHHENY